MTQYPTKEVIEAGFAVVKATENGGRLKSMLTHDDMQAIYLAMRAKEQSHSPTEATGGDVERVARAIEAPFLPHGYDLKPHLLRSAARAAIATLSPNGVSPDCNNKET